MRHKGVVVVHLLHSGQVGIRVLRLDVPALPKIIHDSKNLDIVEAMLRFRIHCVALVLESDESCRKYI